MPRHFYMCAMQHCPRASCFVQECTKTASTHAELKQAGVSLPVTGAYVVQAVHMLHEEVGSLSEGTCGDMLVLPIYAALPPELQACCTSLHPLICNSHMQCSCAT